MSLFHPESERKAIEFLGEDRVESTLGSGIDGVVYSTSRKTAIKIFEKKSVFDTELAAYQRLKAHHVESVCGHAVPLLIDWDRSRWIVEMTIVQPPYVLDFAKAALDRPPDFPPDSLKDWHLQLRDLFEDDFPVAMEILEHLARRYGIYHLDFNPRNVVFRNKPRKS